MGLSDWRKRKLYDCGITEFYYLAPIQNLGGLAMYGILPKNEVEKRKLPAQSFAEETVQHLRRLRQLELSNGTRCTIHDLVPVYLVPKTPTLSVRREQQENLFFIVIASDVVCDDNVEFAFTDGNAASQGTRIFRSLYKLKSIPWDVLKSDYWTDFEDGKRMRNAEFLIYPRIEPAFFKRIVVVSEAARTGCVSQLSSVRVPIDVEVNPGFFFV